MSDDAMRALAKRFFDCVEQGDIDGLVACYAPDAEIWHNTDEAIQGPEDNKKTLSGMVTRILDRVYDNRRVEVFPGGFVQQHVLRGTRSHDGVRVHLPACIVCAACSIVFVRSWAGENSMRSASSSTTTLWPAGR